MLSYVCLGTNDLERTRIFYDAVLGALGMQRCITNDPGWDSIAAGWGTYEKNGAQELAIWVGKPFDGERAATGNGVMVAFSALSWIAVNEFHKAALDNGGASEGGPGLRLQYSADFYAAYVRDPDGNKLAAVCRGFTASQ